MISRAEVEKLCARHVVAPTMLSLYLAVRPPPAALSLLADRADELIAEAEAEADADAEAGTETETASGDGHQGARKRRPDLGDPRCLLPGRGQAIFPRTGRRLEVGMAARSWAGNPARNPAGNSVNVAFYWKEGCRLSPTSVQAIRRVGWESKRRTHCDPSPAVTSETASRPPFMIAKGLQFRLWPARRPPPGPSRSRASATTRTPR